jgi:hypothetical protein
VTDLISAIVGLGVIGAVWRLTREVGHLSASVGIFTKVADDHETRLRHLENHDG